MTAQTAFGVVGQIGGGAIGAMYGMPAQGAALGGLIGGAIGGAVDRNSADPVPRPEAARVQISSYGVPLSLLYGHPRTAGVMFWAAPLEEAPADDSGGGKGGGGPTDNAATNWLGTFAVALAGNEVRGIRRIWANGVLVYDDTLTADSTPGYQITYTLHRGTETQLPDALIESFEGAGNVPAYRGTAYVVVDSMLLTAFGNQIPSLEFEVLAGGEWAVGEVESQDDGTLPVGQGWRWMLYRPDGRLLLIGGAQDAAAIWRVVNPRTWEVEDSGTLPGGIGLGQITDVLMVAEQSAVFVVFVDGVDTLLARYAATTLTRDWEMNLGELPLGNPGGRLAYDHQWPAINIGRGSQLSSWSLQRLDLSTLTLGKADRTTHTLKTIVTGGDVLQLWLHSTLFVARAIGPQQAETKYWEPVDAGWEFVNNIEASGAWLDYGSQAMSGANATGCWDTIRRRYVVLDGAGKAFTVQDSAAPAITEVATGLPTTGSGGQLLFSAAMDVYVHVAGDAVNVLDAETFAVLLSGNLPDGATGTALRLSATDPGAIIHAGTIGLAAPYRLAEYSLYTTTVGTTVRALALQAGYTAGDVDVSELTPRLHGFRITAQAPMRGAIEQLGQVYFFDGAEEDDKLFFKRRGRPTVATYAEADCVVPAADARPIQSRRAAENELPSAVDFSAPDAAADYQPGTQTAQRQASTRGDQMAVAVDVVMSPTPARRVADSLLFDAWHARDTATATLPAAALRLTQGDCITLAGRRYRITARTLENLTARVDLVADDASVVAQYARGAAPAFTAQSVPVSAPVSFAILHSPLLRDQDDTYGAYWAAWSLASGYAGATLFADFALDGVEGNYEFLNTNKGPAATAGVCTAAPGAPASPWLTDEANTITVRPLSGTFASTNDAGLLAGLNACMLGREMLHFRTAELQPDGTYILSGLLRGRRGTEWACAGHGVGELLVMLSTATVRSYDTWASVHGSEVAYAATGLSPYTQRRSVAVGSTLEDYRLRPLAPVQLEASRDAADTVVTWRRRSRHTGTFAGAVGASIPLGEEFERYVLRLYSTGGVLKRTVENLSGPAYTYTAAEQAADFGSPPAAFKAVVQQVSQRTGPGLESEVTTL